MTAAATAATPPPTKISVQGAPAASRRCAAIPRTPHGSAIVAMGTNRGTEEGALPADRGAARRKSRHPNRRRFVIVHDAPKENWSVGYGLAQFV
jgi:hypothetical protein